MKLFSKHFNSLWLLLLILLIPIIVLAASGNIRNGYRFSKNWSDPTPIFANTNNNRVTVSADTIGMCLRNNSVTNDYFVPTGTLNEWNAFSDWAAATGELEPVPCCGDGQCEGGETACSSTSCPSGEAKCVPRCGDGCCNGDEKYPCSDCLSRCGDGYCNSALENNQNCSNDCPVVCGDGYCNPEEGVRGNCSNDCGTCNNGTCETGKGEVCGSGDSWPKCLSDCKLCSCTDGGYCDQSSNEYCEDILGCSGSWSANGQVYFCATEAAKIGGSCDSRCSQAPTGEKQCVKH